MRQVGGLVDVLQRRPLPHAQAERGHAPQRLGGHRALNHLVLADQDEAMLDLPPGGQLDSVRFDDWQELRARREALDAAIEAWVKDPPEGYLQFTMRYSNSAGVQRAHPSWQAISHFFNHQTHHRVQAGMLLMQAGVNVGVTDLMAMV